MISWKRALLVAISLAAGLTVLASTWISDPWLDYVAAHLLDTALLVTAFALLLGLINVLRVHTRRIRARQSGWGSSLVLIAALLLVMGAGLLPFSGQPAGPARPGVQWIFENVQLPIQASISALLVFFTLTAAWRLLRARNLESIVMLVVVLLVLAGQATVGLVPLLPDVRNWILEVPAMAGVRGIWLGVALGILFTSIRLLAGMEHPHGE
jgi:hypothetical protein